MAHDGRRAERRLDPHRFEPLTRDVASWVEVPEYSVLHVEIGAGVPP